MASEINRSNMFCDKNVSGVRVISFNLKDSEINFDRARSATRREITAWSIGSNLQYFKGRRGRPLCGRAVCILGMEARYEVEEKENKKWERKVKE